MSSARLETQDGFDWREARRRLDKLEVATQQAFRRSPEEAIRVMEARARALARVRPEALESEAHLQVVTFALGDERYGLETQHVREVVGRVQLEPIPRARPLLAGVMNLRGEILAVFALSRLLGVASATTTDRPPAVVIDTRGDDFAVLVDEIGEMTALRVRDLLPPPSSLGEIERDFVAGVTRDALIILNGRRLSEEPQLTAP